MAGTTQPADISAFPRELPGSLQEQPGMSLRDWFAGQAPEPPATWWGTGGPKTCAGYATWNYQFADAMLTERSR